MFQLVTRRKVRMEKTLAFKHPKPSTTEKRRTCTM